MNSRFPYIIDSPPSNSRVEECQFTPLSPPLTEERMGWWSATPDQQSIHGKHSLHICRTSDLTQHPPLSFEWTNEEGHKPTYNHFHFVYRNKQGLYCLLKNVWTSVNIKHLEDFYSSCFPHSSTHDTCNLLKSPPDYKHTFTSLCDLCFKGENFQHDITFDNPKEYYPHTLVSGSRSTPQSVAFLPGQKVINRAS